MAFRTFRCEIQTLSGMWYLIPDWEHRSLSHWTTREDPHFRLYLWLFLISMWSHVFSPAEWSLLPSGASPTFSFFWEAPLDFCGPIPNSASSYLVLIVAVLVSCCSTGGLLFPGQTQLPRDRPCIVPFPFLAPRMIMPWAGHWQALRKHLVSSGPDGWQFTGLFLTWVRWC